MHAAAAAGAVLKGSELNVLYAASDRSFRAQVVAEWDFCAFATAFQWSRAKGWELRQSAA